MKRGGTIAGLVLCLAASAHARDFAYSWSRWTVAVPGVLLDNTSGLQWTQHDNGNPINQIDATQYCAGIDYAGGGWRLPTVDELAGIYDENAAGKQCFASDGGRFFCKTSVLFDLTGLEFLSSTPGEPYQGSATAWFVNLSVGHRLQDPVGDDNSKRALCVRRS